MIATRYVTITGVLVALALIPTVIHNYVGLTIEDGRRTDQVAATLAGFESSKSDRKETWGGRLFEATDWSERLYVSGADEVILTVIRSYDLKSLYHHPELAVAYGANFTRHEVQYLGRRGDIPVQVLETDDPTGPVAMYVLHYGDTFVAEPIRFQIKTAGQLLIGGRRPMTLFFAQGQRRRSGVAVSELPWAPVLFTAIEQFLAPPPTLSDTQRSGPTPAS